MILQRDVLPVAEDYKEGCKSFIIYVYLVPTYLRVAAPQIWNMLLPHLKNSNVSREQFKSSLKTWLFVQAYS